MRRAANQGELSCLGSRHRQFRAPRRQAPDAMGMVEPETMEDLLSEEGSYVGEDPGDMAITEVLKETFWCSYCVFSGWGLTSKFCDPCCLGVYKCLCIEGYNGTTDCWNQEESWCWRTRFS